MHIIIAVITAIAGLIWALNRLQNSGVNLNAFNPYFWFRRHQWEKKLGTKPIHRLDKPMEAAAVLLLGIALAENEISREEKTDIIKIFVNEFNLSKNAATELFSASAFMVRGVVSFKDEVKKILTPSKESFSEDNKKTIIEMLINVANLDGEITTHQQDIITEVKKQILSEDGETGSW